MIPKRKKCWYFWRGDVLIKVFIYDDTCDVLSLKESVKYEHGGTNSWRGMSAQDAERLELLRMGQDLKLDLERAVRTFTTEYRCLVLVFALLFITLEHFEQCYTIKAILFSSLLFFLTLCLMMNNPQDLDVRLPWHYKRFFFNSRDEQLPATNLLSNWSLTFRSFNLSVSISGSYPWMRSKRSRLSKEGRNWWRGQNGAGNCSGACFSSNSWNDLRWQRLGMSASARELLFGKIHAKSCAKSANLDWKAFLCVWFFFYNFNSWVRFTFCIFWYFYAWLIIIQ